MLATRNSTGLEVPSSGPFDRACRVQQVQEPSPRACSSPALCEAFDLTGTAWPAAKLAGCDAKTVARYVAIRDAGGDPLARTARPRLIDVFMPKVEELVDRSKGK